MSNTNWEDLKLVKLLLKTQINEFSIFTSLDLPNQRVIKCDVDRTKAEEITKEEKELLEYMLTLYCKETCTSYKQGMNEVLVQFLLLCRRGMPYYLAYYCFKEFISQCLYSMFKDDYFRPLQGLFIIMSLLLKYNVPTLSNFFKENDIFPEVYSTCWFLTLFSTKVSHSDLLYTLWAHLLEEKDPIFPCFIAVSLLDYNQLKILGKEYASIPGFLCKISIDSESDLQEVLRRSQQFKSYLPISIHDKLKHYDIFDLNIVDSYTKALSQNSCLSMLPREIMQLVYPEAKLCNCKSECKFCRISYPVVIIDCRQEEQQTDGYFPNTAFLYDSLIQGFGNVKDFPQQFLGLKGIYHFTLMGDESFPYENTGEESKNVISQLLRAFLCNEFPYISVVEGGYRACHEFALHYKLKIQSHNKRICSICSGKYRSRSFCSGAKELKEKVAFNKNMKIYEIKQYDKTIKGSAPGVLNFIIDFDRIIVADQEQCIVEQRNLRDLIKVRQSSETNKVLTFNFHDSKEEISYSFANGNAAKDCFKQLTQSFSSLKNGVINGFI